MSGIDFPISDTVAAQLKLDMSLYGNAYVTKDGDRLNPSGVTFDVKDGRIAAWYFTGSNWRRVRFSAKDVISLRV